MTQQSTSPTWLAEAALAGREFTIQHVSPWRHNLINLGAFAGVLAVGIGVLAIAPTMSALAWAWWAIPALGLAWFSAFILVVHEASHGMFVVLADKTLQRRINRVAGWMICLPLTIHFDRHWLVGHTVHHRRPLEPDDPQAANCRTGADLLLTVGALLLIPGFSVIQRFVRRKGKASSHTSLWLVLSFPVIWITGTASLAALPGLSWVHGLALFHSLQVLMALNEVKGSLEHGGGLAAVEDRRLRSRTSFFPGRRLLMPWNISLHFEHHLAPLVPWYRLPQYHRAILGIVPASMQPTIFNRRVLAQLAGRNASTA